MCGIVGSFRISAQQPIAEERMRAALQCIAHRGPDDEGLLSIGRATLGQRRLSIIDISAAGHQPFVDDGGRFSIVFNGEVFNYRELKAELESQGHTFRSHTDTEIVLRMYAIKGPDFLHDLNGFFALAIHDKEKDVLFLARDRFGVKPLWWCEVDGHFHFASELRALISLGVPCNTDRSSLFQYLRYQYVAAPHSILVDAHKLEAGCSMHVGSDGVMQDKWYDLVKALSGSKKPTATVHSLFELLNDAVRARLVADVPIGTFLSGGLDSSIISALAKRHHAHLHTFSIGFADDPYFDESNHAEAVAKHIGSDHTTFKLTREELASNYEALLDAIDEPFADSSALPSYILCQRTRQHVTVALSGDGADEVFGGYRKHQAELRMRKPGVIEKAVSALAPLWGALPRSRNNALSDRIRQLHRFAGLTHLAAQARWLALAGFEQTDVVEKLLGGQPPAEVARRELRMVEAVGKLADFNGSLLADVLTVLPNNMLHKVDLTSMAHGLEVRTPFLDKRVVEFAFAMPADAKLRKGQGKFILRDTFGHLLPGSTLARRKQGFDVPLRGMYLGPLSGTLNALLNRSLVEAAGLSWRAVGDVRAELASTSPGESQATVHALLVYLAWWKRWMS
ncbi:MAG: asparagine synthase (glutamine-hydrolyzing) [Flavobacteriales bacterium]|nr:asparagine synthase (glutamine-hydrolyzing) [Flavobacteriales bacterium]